MKTVYSKKFELVGNQLMEELTSRDTKVTVKISSSVRSTECYKILQLFVEIAETYFIIYKDSLEDQKLECGNLSDPTREVLVLIGHEGKVKHGKYDEVFVLSKNNARFKTTSASIIDTVHNTKDPKSFIMTITDGSDETYYIHSSGKTSYYRLVRSLLETTDILSDALNMTFI